MLITHDLGVIAEMADYVVVMYAGRIIEQGTVDSFTIQAPLYHRLMKAKRRYEGQPLVQHQRTGAESYKHA